MGAGLLAFLIALSASLVLTLPVRALALRVGMVDLPSPRKVHLKPIPLLGGLAIYAGVLIAILIVFDGPARAQSFGIVTGASLVAVVGFMDDRGWLHHQVKLFLGMPLAAVILLASGVHANVFNILIGGRAGYWLDALLTLVWVVGITASFSILDHMDGLCAGVAATASIFIVILAYLNAQTILTILAAATLGAATGFLRWNFKPAKIFMGDGGAMFLGFLMATLALKLRFEHSTNLAAWLSPVLILSATIFDTTLVTISRSRRGLLPFATPGKDHSAHRLVSLGFGQRGAVLAMYLAGAICGAAGVLVTYLSTLKAALLGMVVLVAMLVAIIWLERAPYEQQKGHEEATAA
ncbi:MAG TPA: MraY family glycosyltransferase [Candidatus Limnocylindrales bacterium]|nr:MraY family glycosyltransferase [Candidatus Limnocylindrales bacterium]